MKLKTKLFMIFFLVVLIPLMLGYLFIVLFTHYQNKSIKATYEVVGSMDMFAGNSIQIFNTRTQVLQSTIESLANEYPEFFWDESNINSDNSVNNSTLSDNNVNNGTTVDNNTVIDDTANDNTANYNSVNDNTANDSTVDDNTANDKTVNDNNANDSTVSNSHAGNNLTDINTFEEITQTLLEYSANLYVLEETADQERKVIYSGISVSDDLDSSVFPLLESYNSSHTLSDGGIYYQKQELLIKQQDVNFTDQQGNEVKGSIYIVARVGQYLPQIRQLFRQMAIASIVILLAIAFFLTTWIYRTLLQPLAILQTATKEIKDGNLDYELIVDDKDEIGQLCMDFEEMRQRLKASTDEKIQYDKENKELISNISHDLKTPITAIKGYVEGILDGVASSPEKLDKYIRTIYNKANDMDKLIDELTFYSKIDTNKIPYTFSKIMVTRYFGDCAEELRLDLESKAIEFSYSSMVDETTMVIADAEQIKRVINNIVNNSVKYMDKNNPRISLRTKDVGDFVQIEIEDNARGIGAKELPFVFERFYRTDESRNSAQGGSGIGLSIVRKIIEDHGGKIWAVSTEGEGTTMNFVLRKYQEVPNEQDTNRRR